MKGRSVKKNRGKYLIRLVLFTAVVLSAALSHANEPGLLQKALSFIKGPETPNVQSQKIVEGSTKALIDENYIIGPSDVLEIQVWKEPDLSRTVPVRTDGMITLPLINDVKAVGLKPVELKKDLENRLKDFVDTPEISVTVKEGMSRRIYLLGKIRRPGEYLLSKDMTVLQALSLAGGLDEWADSNSILVIRRMEKEEQRFSFDYEKVVAGENIEQNIYLQPNDTIIVP